MLTHADKRLTKKKPANFTSQATSVTNYATLGVPPAIANYGLPKISLAKDGRFGIIFTLRFLSCKSET